jgi:hypothetical protein
VNIKLKNEFWPKKPQKHKRDTNAETQTRYKRRNTNEIQTQKHKRDTNAETQTFASMRSIRGTSCATTDVETDTRRKSNQRINDDHNKRKTQTKIDKKRRTTNICKHASNAPDL